ncbi:MAG: hypothetical protein XU15_C0011G0043 [candidate division NC10 bacterium CSP1-5]|nr:MAG: hypothetical protein XU15_C0011G0043 [candidate division NC10 bacterium CSP1-5]
MRLYILGTDYTSTKVDWVDLENFANPNGHTLLLLDDHNDLVGSQLSERFPVDVTEFVAERKREAEFWSAIDKLSSEKAIALLTAWLERSR